MEHHGFLSLSHTARYTPGSHPFPSSPFHFCGRSVRQLDNIWLWSLSIDGVYFGAPMYADDLTLISASDADLQLMLDIVYEYANL